MNDLSLNTGTNPTLPRCLQRYTHDECSLRGYYCAVKSSPHANHAGAVGDHRMNNCLEENHRWERPNGALWPGGIPELVAHQNLMEETGYHAGQFIWISS